MINNFFKNNSVKDMLDGMVTFGNVRGRSTKTKEKECSVLFTCTKGNIRDSDKLAIVVRFSHFLAEIFKDVEYAKIGIKQNKIYIVPCNIEDDGLMIYTNDGIRSMRLNVNTRTYLL